jgi:hypothetical protein
MLRKFVLAAAVVATFASPALADEGMWTYDNFPAAKVGEKYGFTPDAKWLEHARLSSIKLAAGCSASAVSPDGLTMTNHHCVNRCVQELSTAKKDFIKNGFYAKTPAQELKCPATEALQLVGITDVTQQIRAATQGKDGKDYRRAVIAESAKLEGACQTSEDVRCDVITLYQGGQYSLYKYERFKDVRLVFAPEFAAAFFGGDPDNFEYPRYDLDVAFLRLYRDGKPAKTEHYFQWSQAGAKDGELTFVSGHPGQTSRGYTVAQLEYLRDTSMPGALLHLAELRGMLAQFGERSPEHARISQSLLFGVQNNYKRTQGGIEALQDREFMEKKRAEEQALRAKVDADPKLKATTSKAWDEIAKAEAEMKRLYLPYMFKESSYGLNSALFDIAKTLVRASSELQKPNGERLREFTETGLPYTKVRLMSDAPIYKNLEIERLTWSLTRMRSQLGPDDEFVKKVLGKKSPREVATEAVTRSKLSDVKLRKKLLDGGKAAIEASNDPMIKFARIVEPDAYEIRRYVEDNVESVRKKNGALIASAEFAFEGTSNYPDATGTLRLSYGAVKGYQSEGKQIPPFTTFTGGYERHSGREPFALPPSWLKAKGKVDQSTPLNFVTTNDIIGGNSGSPVINQKAEIVGLVFDGNIESLAGDFYFDERVNRTVAVHSAALIEALDSIYGAKRLVQELQPAKRDTLTAPGAR